MATDPLEARIDDLYKGSLADFVNARQTLAKASTGDAAKRVKALAKPTLVPWTVNQVYWHARPTYDRVLKAGEKLRTAQVAALRGKSADVGAASNEHRKAIADAVKEAARFASDAGAKPDHDALARMLEAASLATTLSETHGRFTKPLQPAGFEALAGLSIAPKLTIAPPPARAGKHPREADRQPTAREREAAEAQRKEEARRQAALAKARTALIEAKADATKARVEWDRAQDRVLDAERALKELEK